MSQHFCLVKPQTWWSWPWTFLAYIHMYGGITDSWPPAPSPDLQSDIKYPDGFPCNKSRFYDQLMSACKFERQGWLSDLSSQKVNRKSEKPR